jgi:oligoendopeptidase F
MRTRDQVPKNECWNVDTIFENLELWETKFQELKKKLPEFKEFKGTLNLNPKTLKTFLEVFFSYSREIEKVYVFAHLKHDEDLANNSYKTAYFRSLSLLQEFRSETSWFEPELLTLKEDFIDSDLLTPYRFYLEKILRLKKHTLSEECEKLIALSSQSMQTGRQAFSALNDADFVFGKILDEKGQSHELTHATYSVYLKDHDRVLRKNAFTTLLKKYDETQNTLAELLKGEIESHVFTKVARGYDSCLEAALFPYNIDKKVYEALIDAVTQNLKPLHKYYALRKKALKLETLHLYDLAVPLIQEIDIKMSYEEAEDTIIESVAPLGKEYQEALRKGLKEGRWVDRFENKNKRSGAYSSGCFETEPFILMNYKNHLRDVFTLAHEAGHSMHSFLSHKSQPYHLSDYPIFLAEVASTFNEDLLSRTLQKTENKQEKIYLISQQIDDIRNTLFRQTMFAEFELKIHELAEESTPLTPTLLCELYKELLKKYFGSEVVLDEEASFEWARIPHFYYNFYVYQYATGISAALALSKKVNDGGEKDKEAYLNFLKSGSSHYPLETLKIAGVDMSQKEPVKEAIQTFKRLVDELETLLQF